MTEPNDRDGDVDPTVGAAGPLAAAEADRVAIAASPDA